MVYGLKFVNELVEDTFVKCVIRVLAGQILQIGWDKDIVPCAKQQRGRCAFVYFFLCPAAAHLDSGGVVCSSFTIA